MNEAEAPVPPAPMESAAPTAPPVDDYAISFADQRFSADAAVNARLRAAGFSPDQAQLVYDLAVEQLGPALDRFGAEAEQRAATTRLAERFGGADRWTETKRQLRAWGEANLPRDAFDAMASSEQGVMALHALMQQGGSAPPLGRTAATAGAPAGEEALRTMMRDPRYWKTRDPGFIAQVSDGFRRQVPQ